MKKYAYIDESGNTDLDTSKNGVSKYFIICAVVIDSSKLNDARDIAESIRRDDFDGAEIKSSKVKDTRSPARRINILKKIFEIDFALYAISIEKDELITEGFKYKQPFLKYLNGRLYKLLFENYDNLSAFADEHGSDDFKKSFKNYVQDNCVPSLFDNSKIEFISSEDEILIQISDFLAGSLAKIYEGKASAKLREEFEKMLKSKPVVYIHDWPIKLGYYANSITDNTDDFSNLILSTSLTKAAIFLEKNKNSKDEDIKLQVDVLDFLLYRSRISNEEDYTPTEVILNYFNGIRGEKLTKHYFRTNVISKLRDSDVLISSSLKGYKIPQNMKDIQDFVSIADTNTVPLLLRIKKAKEILCIASDGKLNIISHEKYPSLSRLIEVCENKDLSNDSVT